MHLTRRHPFQAACVRAVACLGLVLALAPAAPAQAPTSSLTTQDPAMVYRSGLWKQWIYWAIPGPQAYAAIQRIVAEVNAARATAGLPLLIPDPANEIVVSVIDERNARGANGSSAYPATANQEAFLATFVSDAAGGFEVLFLSDPLRSNAVLTAKGVVGEAAQVERGMEFKNEQGVERVETEWKFASASGVRLSFSANYPGTAVYYHGIAPASRLDYARSNLTHSADIIYRSLPTQVFPLFAREESNYIDLAAPGVKVKVQVEHHDHDLQTIFNDPKNLPEVLIALDRDVRIERR